MIIIGILYCVLFNFSKVLFDYNLFRGKKYFVFKNDYFIVIFKNLDYIYNIIRCFKRELCFILKYIVIC